MKPRPTSRLPAGFRVGGPLALGAALLAGSPRAEAASPGRTVELILDASGSMNARLADGTPRIDAARVALGRLVAGLPAETVIALRVYGAGSARDEHDCADTRLAVPFGSVATVKGQVVAAAAALKAQGYTPITKVLELAAADFPAGGSERVIVLVSDGRETCDGDPCAMAQALARAKVKTLIHTVGFGADATALAQLRCISSVTGGRHFGAGDAAGLAAVLAQAVAAKGERVAEKPGTGTLGVRGADLRGCRIIDAATGREVGTLGHTRQSTTVPAGIYNVTIATSTWRSVQVRAGEETWLEPAILTVDRASLRGHEVLDVETGEVVARVSAAAAVAAVLPGTYDVRFGQAVWAGVVLEAGKRTVLEPGVITVRGAKINGHAIRDANGNEVGEVSASGSSMPLPPGAYTVELTGGPRKFTLAEGEHVDLDNR
jgi:hypothetical protein